MVVADSGGFPIVSSTTAHVASSRARCSGKFLQRLSLPFPASRASLLKGHWPFPSGRLEPPSTEWTRPKQCTQRWNEEQEKTGAAQAGLTDVEADTAARLEELGQVLKDRRDTVLAALKHEREVIRAVALSEGAINMSSTESVRW